MTTDEPRVLDAVMDPYVLARPVLDDAGVCRDFEYVYANDAACRYNRVSRRELIGSRVLTLLPSHERSGLLVAYVQVMETGEPLHLRDFVYAHERHSDRPRRYDLTAARFGDLLAVTWRDVTDPLEMAQRFRLAMANAAIGICIATPEGRFLEVNPSMCELFGRTEQDLKARTWQELTHPDDVAKDLDLVEQVLAGQRDHFRLEKRFLRSDGSVVYGEVVVSGVRRPDGEVDYFVGQITNHTEATQTREELQAEQELRAEAARYRGLMAFLRTGLVVQAPDGRITDSNEAASEILGLSRDQLLGRTSVDPRWRSVHTDGTPYPGEEHPAMEALRTGEPVRDAIMGVVKPDGSLTWIVVNAQPVPAAEADENTAVVSSFADITMYHKAQSAVAAQAQAAARRAEAELMFRETNDPLTGLLNRTSFVDEMQRQIAAGDPGHLALLLLDIDRFKLINDAVSRRAGDELLVGFGRRLSASARTGDLVGRFDADQFAVLLRPGPREELLASLAERIRDAIVEQPFDVEGSSLWITASAGMTTCRDRDANQSVLAADAALRAAKDAGRNSWRFYTEDIAEQAASRLETAQRLHTALRDHRVHAWYQPVVSLDDHRVVEHEALARWIAEDGAPIPAAEFIRAAQENGLMSRVGRVIAEEALTRLAEMPESVTMAVNASPTELADPEHLALITRLLEDNRLRPERLVIEVTEDSLLALRPAAEGRLSELISTGVGLHVDDFGTGYSSLVTLRDFPVTGVKLDRSFTQFLGGSSDHAAVKIARGLAQLADSLGLTRIAEGIETPAQEAAAFEVGWEFGQGHLFGKAVPEPA